MQALQRAGCAELQPPAVGSCWLNGKTLLIHCVCCARCARSARLTASWCRIAAAPQLRRGAHPKQPNPRAYTHTRSPALRHLLPNKRDELRVALVLHPSSGRKSAARAVSRQRRPPTAPTGPATATCGREAARREAPRIRGQLLQRRAACCALCAAQMRARSTPHSAGPRRPATTAQQDRIRSLLVIKLPGARNLVWGRFPGRALPR